MCPLQSEPDKHLGTSFFKLQSMKFANLYLRLRESISTSNSRSPELEREDLILLFRLAVRSAADFQRQNSTALTAVPSIPHVFRSVLPSGPVEIHRSASKNRLPSASDGFVRVRGVLKLKRSTETR